jgi:phospholipase/carboxylesterase
LNTTVIEPKQKAQACIIWMHGLGASADDMTSLAKQLPLNVPVRHVALDAPTRPVTFNQGMVMPAWYDVKGFTLEDKEDKPGVLASEQIILDVIKAQVADGFLSETIFLAGFSQGGAMALFTAVQTEFALGGVIVLSAYLPLASECQPKLNRKTPMFIASGRHDQVLLPAWTATSVTWLREQGFEALTVQDYPMEHSVCFEEVQALGVWFEQQMTVIQSVAGEI